ncbi:DnaJ domain-containing protein [Desulfofustis glycolicus]|uniref:DnaJ domain-containing protein n=1 Tax=Desulfofustis glycolicus DSM 9705 TaxID=1121409 RepID=A0A1M5V5M4_9BACT|nr:DnaJ domain-containing protein [Desulfofustis glycolicus]MCB2214979.1 DnaJ domain-containing protein [Desulfobulbaceae bacterium]SHH70486.1 DnaJ domain-containing protein [Desulfofustis glycolicus DSM 9705]
MIVYLPLALVLLLFLAGWLILSTPPEKSAAVIVSLLPLSLVGVGVLLTLLGRGVIGVPMTLIGLSWWQRKRAVQRAGGGRRGQRSRVQTGALDMELDHDTGDMDGQVRGGQFSGSRLSQLGRKDLMTLYAELSGDAESRAVLEAYLDRRFPDWRADSGGGGGHGESSHDEFEQMSREEAYQILGLQPGAGEEEIHQAWRRMMKKVHPDSGGSAFLAAKINAAKDLLLGRR